MSAVHASSLYGLRSTIARALRSTAAPASPGASAPPSDRSSADSYSASKRSRSRTVHSS